MLTERETSAKQRWQEAERRKRREDNLPLFFIFILFIVIPHSLLWGSGDLVSRACSGVNTRLYTFSWFLF